MKKCPYCVTEIHDTATKCPNCREWLQERPIDKDRQELERRRMTDAVRDSVEKTLVRRYSWLGIMVAALTGGVGTLLVNNALSRASTELRLAERLRGQADSAIDSLLEARRTLEDLGRRALRADSTLDNLTLTAQELEDRLSRTATDGFDITRSLNEKVDSLAAVLASLASQRTNLVQRLTDISTTAPNIDSASIEASRVATLGAIRVTIHPLFEGDLDGLKRALERQSLTVRLSPYASPGDHDVVWISDNIPLEVATSVVTEALRFGRPKKVGIYVPSFRNTIVIGGGDLGGPIRDWSRNELNRLIATEWSSLEQLQRYIVSFRR